MINPYNVLKVESNFAGDQIIVDLGGLIQEEEASFQIEIIDEEGGLSYASKTDVGTLTVPVHQLRGTGVYFLSVKDSKGAELWISDALFIEASNSK